MYLEAKGKLRLVPGAVRARADDTGPSGKKVIEEWVLDPDGVTARCLAEEAAFQEHQAKERGQTPPETTEELATRLQAEGKALQSAIEAANAEAAAPPPAPAKKTRTKSEG